MGKTYTKEQQRVIDERDCNILVSAAAGSGKTAVLTDRIISIVTDDENPIDVDHILVLTYTNAAAAEMRERIDAAISKKISAMPFDVNLQRQKLLIQNAQISTIHSFCLFVLHNNFGDIGLDPGFRIMDEGERKLLLTDTLGKILENYYADDEDEAFVKLVECYASDINEGSLEDTILAIHNFILSLRSPEKWLGNAKEDFNIRNISDFQDSEWWKNGTLPTINYIIQESLLMARKGLALSQEKDGPKNSVKGFNDYIALFEALQKEEDYEKRYELIHKASISRFSASPKADHELKAKAKYIKETIATCLSELKDTYYLVDAKTFIDDNIVMEDIAEKLLEIVNVLYTEFDKVKRDKNLIDFSDMEHLTLKVLADEDGNPTKTAEEYKQYFEAVMVDEYQDINDVQEAILKSITRDNNYFMVGDVKQSIYKFRQARPEIFMGKYDEFKDQGINTKIELNKNFRSRKQVLDFVNMVFEYTMKKRTTEIEYDDNAKLKFGALCYDKELDKESDEESNLESDKKAKISYLPEVLLMEKPDKAEAESLGIKNSGHSAEAELVASKITELISSGIVIFDKEEERYRPIQYKDIVILLFSVSSKGGIFKETLEKYDIPVISENTTGYFNTEEIKSVLNLLEIINNPMQDIPLFGVLTSFFGGFSEMDIAELRAKTGKGSLYKSVFKYIKKFENEELTRRLVDFVQKLNNYRYMTTYMGVRELLDNIILNTGYLDYISVARSGVQKKANVLLLLEKASDFERTSYHGLFRFIRYIKQLKVKDADWGEAITLDENEDAVRIMTIHKSKGLEYPVCFLCSTDSLFLQDEARKSAVLHPEFGMAMDMVNPVKRIKRKSFKRSILVRKAEIDNISEQLRVLYVALTRAREKLYVTGMISIGKTDKSKGKTAKEVFIEKLSPEGSFSELSMFFMNSYLKIVCNSISSHGLTGAYIKFYNYRDLVSREVAETINSDLNKEALSNNMLVQDEEYKKLLEERIGFDYEYKYLSKLKSKVSVSELKKTAFEESLDNNLDEASSYDYEDGYVSYYVNNHENNQNSKNNGTADDDKNKLEKQAKKKLARNNRFIPNFIMDKNRDKEDKGDKKNAQPAKNVVGSACHKLMELIDYEKLSETLFAEAETLSNNDDSVIKSVLRSLVDEKVESGKLTEEYWDIILTGAGTGFIAIDAATEFLKTDLALRMVTAAKKNKLYKEKSFFMGISAHEVNDEFPESENVLVQGIADVFFEDEDGDYVLVDYKTDNLDNIAKDGSWTVDKNQKAVTVEEKAEALKQRYKVQLELYSQAIERVTGKKVKEKIIYAFDILQKIYI